MNALIIGWSILCSTLAMVVTTFNSRGTSILYLACDEARWVYADTILVVPAATIVVWALGCALIVALRRHYS